MKLFFEKLNKIEVLLAKVTKKRREDSNNIRNEIG